MPSQLEFCLLGPLLVRSGSQPVPIGRAKERSVLAALLLRAGRMVPVDELADAVWEACPPRTAAATLRNYVKRLRDALGESGRDRICTQPPGYLIRVEAGELDITRFEAMLEAARASAAQESWDACSRHAASALALWRGRPLQDAGCELLAAREVPRLAELRLQAAELQTGAEIHLGRHSAAIADLERLAVTYPLRERLHELLMLALYRDGRQADALAAYQRVRTMLVGDIGTEPGSGLSDLHQRILACDPALAVRQPVAGPARAAGHIPRQLPGPVRHFVGRSEELSTLCRVLDDSGRDTPRTVVITTVCGTAGVGKSALAVHWADRVADRFPDGQLYLNMRGYDAAQPMTAGEAMAGFLRALGVAGPDIPAETDERAARYRSMMAGRRMLVLLDNARQVEQVRALLPPAPACVLVTSRDSLAGLVARDGAVRLDLDLLPLDDCVALLRALIGRRAEADPQAAEALAVRCACLPLALRVAAELAAARPAVPLAELAAELADQQQRLDLLDADGDPGTAIRAVFSWSYRHLDDDAARAFRLLGLHPGPDLDVHAAAALCRTTVASAGRLLTELARAHLIQVLPDDRCSMHDLLRAYAAERVGYEDPEQDRHAALTRLLGHYLTTASTAMDALHPAERHRRPRVPPPATPAPPVSGHAAARSWLDAQREALVAITAHATAHGWPGQAIQLAATLYRYLTAGGYYAQALTMCDLARRAARDTGDRVAEATALTSLGALDWQLGRCQQAVQHHEQALDLFRAAGDRAGQARALTNLGVVDDRLGRYQRAASHFQQALALYRETGDRFGEARALGNLGSVDEQLGRYRRAADHQRRALALCRQSGDKPGEARALGCFGTIEWRLGRYQRAADYQLRVLALGREAGDRFVEAHALTDLGCAEERLGRYQQAADHHNQALAMFRQAGDRNGEAEALNGLGEAMLGAGLPGQARTEHAAARDLAMQTSDQYQLARSQYGLGRSSHAAGDLSAARRHWQQALSQYASLGVPETRTVRACLTAR